MKKAHLIAVAVTVVVLLVLVLGLLWVGLNTRIDASWTAEVEVLVEGYQLYPEGAERSNPDVTISACSMYLAENGTERLIYYGNGDALSGYLGGLLRNASMRVGAVSEGYLDEVLANDKVVVLSYRITILGLDEPGAKYYMGYFILEDNLGRDLQGFIIAREIQTNNLQLLAIPK